MKNNKTGSTKTPGNKTAKTNTDNRSSGMNDRKEPNQNQKGSNPTRGGDRGGNR